MEFNSPGNDPSSLASERLRKAIERNRRKQELRQKMEAGEESHEQVPFGQEWAPPKSSRMETPPPPPPLSGARRAAAAATARSETGGPSFTTSGSLPATIPTRQRVARPDDIDFTETPRRSTTKRVGDIVEYAPSSRSTSKRVAAAPTPYRAWMIKGAWALVDIFALRLVPAKRGVMAYHQRLSILEGKTKELSQIHEENMGLSKEIELIKSDGTTQKKLVRDHLGFIAEDEYLVLFPREDKTPPI